MKNILFIVLLVPFYFINRITINELSMRFGNYDKIQCVLENKYSEKTRRSTNTYYYKYNYGGKSYTGSSEVRRYSEVSKKILSGNVTTVPLYVSNIFPSYSSIEKPSFNSFEDFFTMVVMLGMSFFSFWIYRVIFF
tara:strand:- start:107 stop:514 length:408 start_codon:yes stop_codon:yes gene_type:complete